MLTFRDRKSLSCSGIKGCLVSTLTLNGDRKSPASSGCKGCNLCYYLVIGRVLVADIKRVSS